MRLAIDIGFVRKESFWVRSCKLAFSCIHPTDVFITVTKYFDHKCVNINASAKNRDVSFEKEKFCNNGQNSC